MCNPVVGMSRCSEQTLLQQLPTESHPITMTWRYKVKHCLSPRVLPFVACSRLSLFPVCFHLVSQLHTPSQAPLSIRISISLHLALCPFSLLLITFDCIIRVWFPDLIVQEALVHTLVFCPQYIMSVHNVRWIRVWMTFPIAPHNYSHSNWERNLDVANIGHQHLQEIPLWCTNE